MALGSWLAQARDDAGLTIADVANATRLRPGVIVAIESGDLGTLGGDVYARGHVRAIAAVIGLDPDDVRVRLDAALTGPG